MEKIKTEVFLITVYSAIITYVDQEYFFKDNSIPLPIPSILGTAISLLLAFRTNQAYDRWWEARIIWGAIVNDSRTLIRQVQTFYQGKDPQFIRSFVNRQVAWCYSLGERLRGSSQIETINRYLNKDDVDKIKNDDNIPNSILSLHNEAIKTAFENQSINEFQQVQIDETISKLCDSMGRAERIKNTVFPRTYSILLHVLIYVFATILPLGLTDFSMKVEIILNVTITLIFFLIERTAVYKQDPFENRPTDTPVTSIARTIEINLLQMIGQKENVPEKLQDNGFYLM